MSEEIPIEFHPLMLLHDRYGGVYSGGVWTAIREADQIIEGVSRAAWVVQNGPSGGDLEASEFWSEAPDWIASGTSPEEAIRALVCERDRKLEV